MVSGPQASVILVASRGRESVARIMGCLRSQSVAPLLEVVIASRPEHVADLQMLDPGAIGALVVVPADLTTSARARVAALDASRAPILIFAEDHAFPRDDIWAERLIAAHAGPFAAVGPSIGNANPGTGLSWANLVAEYGPWLCPGESRDVDALPGHNSSYKRAALSGHGDALPDLLEAEWLLHRALRERGERLRLLSDVTVDHVNFSRVLSATGIMFWGGWMFAASRAADWGRGRGLAYGLAAPLIFAMRVTRALGHLSRCREDRPSTASILPSLALLLAANAVGEALGHVFGDCGLRHELGRREFDRWQHVAAGEADLFGGASAARHGS